MRTLEQMRDDLAYAKRREARTKEQLEQSTKKTQEAGKAYEQARNRKGVWEARAARATARTKHIQEAVNTQTTKEDPIDDFMRALFTPTGNPSLGGKCCPDCPKHRY